MPILKRYLYPRVYYSIIYNSQNMENTQVSTAKQIGKANVAYTMKYLSAMKRSKSWHLENMDKFWGHYAK